MSSKGIYAALSGAIAQGQRLDNISNNLANTNTPGFKKDQTVFREYLSNYEKLPTTLNVPRVPASVESFYDMQGADRGYAEAIGSFSDYSQGTLLTTGNNLDIAIEGEGFLEVLTPQGVRFSRSGNLRVDSQGVLVNQSGFPVLKTGAQDPAQRVFNVRDSNVTISFNGDIYDRDENLGKLSIINFEEKDVLRKEGNSLFSLRPNTPATPIAAREYKIHQGYIESSNVNIVQEMTDMIAANRLFESSQKAIKAFDQMDEKLNNEVPKTRA
ncbi:MAG: flagellar biosynthesis protein [Proteobacteria bacterium SG_bin7]|nr:MAG: flagellar biosynthesis protein [Proteobacteria bacterium SG_bin7]